MTTSPGPSKSPLVATVCEALLTLEGTVIDDFKIPLPGDLKDITKAAALVSGVVEARIPILLNSVRDRTWDIDGDFHEYEFRRFTIGFPDILLVRRSDPDDVIFELEAKSWYALSGDALTGRFLTSHSAITTGTVLAIVGWMLDGVVSGSPQFLRIFTDDAARLAKVRDAAWESIPPAGSHRVVQPQNAPGTAQNLLQKLARGEQLQGTEWRADSDNFGKIDRIHDPALAQFTDDVLSLIAAGKPLREWRNFIAANPAKAAKAAKKAAKKQAAMGTPLAP